MVTFTKATSTANSFGQTASCTAYAALWLGRVVDEVLIPCWARAAWQAIAYSVWWRVFMISKA